MSTFKLPEQRTESCLGDLKPAYTEIQAKAEASRCLYCYDAPCITACPTAIDIPEFIHQIASNNYKSSAKTILDSNILGMSCARVCPVEVLCVGNCVYNNMEQAPIEIGKLQRFSTDWAYEQGIQYYSKGKPTGKKVALIGGGPASLACAAELTIMGHDTVIFEKNQYMGGLNTDGVAPYKMRAEDSLREVEFIKDIGVEFKTGVEIGKDISFETLEQDYDAIFIGTGLGPDSTLKMAGEDLDGSFGALEVIRLLKMGTFPIEKYQKAIIVGGGNTALDAVRELKKLGIPEVTMVYRRNEETMTGYKHEAVWARKEGVQFQFQTQPIEVLGSEKVEGLRCVKMELSAPDESGRQRPTAVEGSEFDIPADLVLQAVGQEKLTSFLSGISNLTLEWGKVVVNEQGQTSNPKYFSGGDCANGGKEVVNAAAEGKLAAQGIDQYMRGNN